MSASPTRIAVNGAAGRMGQRVCALLTEHDGATLVAAIDRAPVNAYPTLHDDTAIDALIDFSSARGAIEAAALAGARRAALLVCTTGLDQEALHAIERASRTVPTMIAPNTSLGVAVLRRVAAEAARLLGSAYTIEIVEAHHDRKRDAPSGTALSLATALAEAGRPVESSRIHAIRGGDIVGEHEVWLAGPGETLRLAHSAVSRDLFALGAIRAACWLATRQPGAYVIEDSLGR